MNGKSLLAVAFSMIAIAVLFSFLVSYPVMLLWNGCLVPAVAGLSEVSWLQMWGISILCNLLIKSHASASSK